MGENGCPIIVLCYARLPSNMTYWLDFNAFSQSSLHHGWRNVLKCSVLKLDFNIFINPSWLKNILKVYPLKHCRLTCTVIHGHKLQFCENSSFLWNQQTSSYCQNARLPYCSLIKCQTDMIHHLYIINDYQYHLYHPSVHIINKNRH